MFRAITRPAIIWAAPIARLLVTAIVIDSLFEHSQPLTHWIALLWVVWAAITLASTVIGQYSQISALRLIVLVDSFVGAVTLTLIPGSTTPIIAMLITSAVVGFGCGLGQRTLMWLFALPFAAWAARSLANLLSFALPKIVTINDNGTNLLILMIQLVALAALAALIHRRASIDTFARECTSIDMLRPDRSFEFDLQDMVDKLARIFVPERAFCLVAGASSDKGLRLFHHDCDLSTIATDIPNLFELSKQLPTAATIFDTEENMCWPLNEQKPRAFTEVEQRFAHYLKREHLVVALVQPLHFGRSTGLLVNAAMPPVDACLFTDARRIENNISRLTDFLGRISEAERQFILDAHDVARRDLHDGVLQSMAALRMKLLTIAKRKDMSGHPAHLELRKAADILTLEQVRLRGLLETSASENDTINLVARLDICLRAISLQWEVDAKLQSEEPAVPVDRESALNIEHLVREAVANAVRHAKISSLTVMLSLKHDVLLIAINEAGGALSESRKEGVSMPLQSASLQHRLRLVNGTAYAQGLAKGTLLAINIPMQQVEDA